MKWLLRLYPRSWRDRYGEEFEALLAAHSLSPSLAIDLIAGAIDARLHPQLAVRAPAAKPPNEQGEKNMLAKLMKLRCAGYGPNVTTRDQWIGGAIMIGGTFVLTLVWMALHVAYGDNPYVDAFSFTPFMVALVMSMPFTSLKGRSRGAQTIFVGGTIAALVAISLVTGFITARI
jgi:hypothetical protein